MSPPRSRSARDNEVTIAVGGQVIIHALIRLDEGADPVHVDYCDLDGGGRGLRQLGIMTWVDGDACFCMAAPGDPRPAGFESAPGSGRTLSRWRRKDPRP